MLSSNSDESKREQALANLYPRASSLPSTAPLILLREPPRRLLQLAEPEMGCSLARIPFHRARLSFSSDICQTWRFGDSIHYPMLNYVTNDEAI